MDARIEAVKYVHPMCSEQQHASCILQQIAVDVGVDVGVESDLDVDVEIDSRRAFASSVITPGRWP